MRYNNSRISFENDQLFASGVLTVLRHRYTDLPADAYATLLSVATEPAMLNRQHVQDAMNAVLNLHPVLARHVTPAEIQLLCFLPVCIWAAEEENRSSSLSASLLLEWGHAFPEDKKARLLMHCRALNIAYGLREEWSPSDLNALAAFWHDDTPCIWDNEYILTDTLFYSQPALENWCAMLVRLELFHEFVEVCDSPDNARKGHPAWSQRWAHQGGSALQDMTLKNQASSTAYWMKSAISRSSALRICKYANPQAWLAPEFAALVEPCLPKSEAARWPMLPWAAPPTSLAQEKRIETNQAMARRYCPESFAVLTIATTPENWDDRKAIARCMARFATKASALETLDVNGLLDGPLESDNYESHA